jgi:putative Holliday junction resolvase
MNIKTYLGFDVGTKRTGVAIANSLTHTANGIGVSVYQHHRVLHSGDNGYILVVFWQ